MSNPHLLLLHGAIGSSSQLEPLAIRLKENFTIHTLNFKGHGGNESENDFSIELFANDVLRWIEENSLPAVNIFGYSMGGYVGLYLARYYPEKISKLFTLATKVRWSPEISQQEIKKLNPEKIEEKIPAFAEALSKRHYPADWKKVLEKTSAMMLAMGDKNVLLNDDYKNIEHRITLSLGDSDAMVSLEETIEVFRLLGNGSLLVLPQTMHPIETVNTDMLAFHLTSFFSE